MEPLLSIAGELITSRELRSGVKTRNKNAGNPLKGVFRLI